MTREESKRETCRAFRKAQTGKEIAEAMIAHFKKYTIPEMKTLPEEKAPDYSDAISTLNAPLFGLEPR